MTPEELASKWPEELASEWLEAKLAEKQAADHRRKIEDQFIALFRIAADHEGVSTFDAGRYDIKATARINRKVDADKLQEIALENGTFEHLQRLFRWKPEISMAAWKAADPAITEPLRAAITATPAKPSFSIVIKE